MSHILTNSWGGILCKCLQGRLLTSYHIRKLWARCFFRMYLRGGCIAAGRCPMIVSIDKNAGRISDVVPVMQGCWLLLIQSHFCQWMLNHGKGLQEYWQNFRCYADATGLLAAARTQKAFRGVGNSLSTARKSFSLISSFKNYQPNDGVVESKTAPLHRKSILQC